MVVRHRCLDHDYPAGGNFVLAKLGILKTLFKFGGVTYTGLEIHYAL